MIKKYFLIVAFFFVVFFPLNSFAQTLHEEISKQVNENYGDRFSFVELLSIEKTKNTPSQKYIVEISIKGKAKLRLPAKISKIKKIWNVDWLPKGEYVVALENLTTSGQLAEFDSPSWDRISRLPAFPVLLTSKRTITPFGVLDAPMKGEKHSPLSLHAARWINGALDADPALAAFEIITPAQTKWSAIHNIMMDLAGVHGLFQMYLVGATTTGVLTSMQLRTTVGAKMPTRIISLARSEKYEGVKVVIKNEKGMKEVSTVCPTELPEGKYCDAVEDPIPKIIEGLFSTRLEKNERVILGFSKDIMIKDAFEMVTKLSKKLEIGSDRFLVTLVVE